MKPFPKLFRILIFFVFFVSLASPGQAAPSPAAGRLQTELPNGAGLFADAAQPASPSPAGENIHQGERPGKSEAGYQSGPTRSRFVTVRLAQLGELQASAAGQSGAAQQLQLNLFEDLSLAAVLDQVKTDFPGLVTWQGHVEGQEQTSQVRLTLQGESLQGTITTQQAVYHLSYVGSGVHKIEQTAPEPAGLRLEAGDEAGAPPDGHAPGKKTSKESPMDERAAAVESLLLENQLVAEAPAPQPALASPLSPVDLPIFLPVILKPANPGRISGRVLQNGAPAAGVELDLRFWDGANWGTMLVATSDASGYYSFVGAPALQIDEEYYVRFMNNEEVAGRLWRWNTDSITDYDNDGDLITLRDFDIVDLPLVSPANASSQSLATTFQWTARSAAPSESYGVEIYSPDYSVDWWLDYDLGHVNSYKMISLPEALSTYTSYDWIVYINSDSGYGESFPRAITFTSTGMSGITGRVLRAGTPQSGLAIKLYLWNGSSWIYQSTSTTTADGAYAFSSAATLPDGYEYGVEYYNDAGTSGRVYWWDPYNLTDYTAGTNVQINDFDIADVTLSSPNDGSTVNLPRTFSWTRRTATPSDDYQFRIYDAATDAGLRNSLGYVGSYQMAGLGWYLDTGAELTWYIRVYGPGGYGNSGKSRNVTISNRGSAGIHGRILQNGAAAPDVPVQLRFFDGYNWSTAWSTSTQSDGNYGMTDQPVLAAGQKYQVRFLNTSFTAGRLWSWYAPAITSYPTYGGNTTVSDFDIADIPLVSPISGVPVAVPTTFQWTTRPATPSDSYRLDIYDDDSYKWWWTSPLGFTGSYSLTYVPVPFFTDTEYLWYVVVENSAGVGVSSVAENVTFSSPAGSGINGMVYQDGGPARGVDVELWRYNGSTWSPLLTATTNSKGLYQFTGAPTLTAGQKYQVEYYNNEDSEGRLLWWDTNDITSYTAGQNLHLTYFDIADIPLVWPDDGASRDMPVVFAWDRRTNLPLDDYEFDLSDPVDDDPEWWTDPSLGYVGSYWLDSLPAGFSTGLPYDWYVWAYGPNGFGMSYFARSITFTSTGNLKPAPDAPQGSRPLGSGLLHSHSHK